jgi:diacylglycerol kinase (ATP)
LIFNNTTRGLIIKTAILVNASANNNTGEKKWLLIRDRVLDRLPSNTVIISYKTGFDIEQCIRELIAEQNINCIISAGGDGSINYILNAIISCLGESPGEMHLGAIGLGSSNDFMKPVSKTLSGIPVQIDLAFPKSADIGKVTFVDENATNRSRYFIVNASIGVTAEANLLFNEGDFFIHHAKARFINATILYAAVKTILTYKNRSIQLAYDNVRENIIVTNLSVVKNPNISGSFKYDQEISINDGYLGLNYFYDLNKRELLKALYDLNKGRFSGRPKRCSVLTKNVKITSAEPLALETDGEVNFANNIEFSIIPNAIQVLGK